MRPRLGALLRRPRRRRRPAPLPVRRTARDRGAVTSFAAARFPQLAPALKMGVAYPLANRFRTGMTIAMFSLIVFSIVTVQRRQRELRRLDDRRRRRRWLGRGHDGEPQQPGRRRRAALRRPSTMRRRRHRARGRVTTFTGASRSTGRRATTAWTYPVIAGDDEFFMRGRTKLDVARTRLRRRPCGVRCGASRRRTLALVDTSDFGGVRRLRVHHRRTSKRRTTFEPFEVTISDPVTGQRSDRHRHRRPGRSSRPRSSAGVYVNEAAYTGVFGEPALPAHVHPAGRRRQRRRRPPRRSSPRSARRACRPSRSSQLLDDVRGAEPRLHAHVPGVHGARPVRRHHRPRRHRLPLGRRAAPADRHAAGHRLPEPARSR